MHVNRRRVSNGLFCGLLAFAVTGCGDSAPAVEWSVQQGDTTLGPMPENELREMVLEGQLPFDSMVREGGGTEGWSPLEKSIPSMAKERVAATWARAFHEYAVWGDPGKIAKNSVEKSNYALWLNAAEPPAKPAPGVAAILEKATVIIDPLLALDGAWSPVLDVDGTPISSRSIRGLGRTIWGDLRQALVMNEHERVLGDLILLANLPRVAAESDPTARGFMTTLATMGIFGWALSDVEMFREDGGSWSITPAQYQQVVQASDWMENPKPFGAENEANSISWSRFQSRELGRIRALLQQLGN